MRYSASAIAIVVTLVFLALLSVGAAARGQPGAYVLIALAFFAIGLGWALARAVQDFGSAGSKVTAVYVVVVYLGMVILPFVAYYETQRNLEKIRHMLGIDTDETTADNSDISPNGAGMPTSPQDSDAMQEP